MVVFVVFTNNTIELLSIAGEAAMDIVAGV